MRQSDFNEYARVLPQNLSDVLARIGREIGSIDEELKLIDSSVESDLQELYNNRRLYKYRVQPTESYDEFKEKHQNRLITIKTQALTKAKNDLNELKAEILRAC
jgi:hypothetical protein